MKKQLWFVHHTSAYGLKVTKPIITTTAKNAEKIFKKEWPKLKIEKVSLNII